MLSGEEGKGGTGCEWRVRERREERRQGPSECHHKRHTDQYVRLGRGLVGVRLRLRAPSWAYSQVEDTV